MATVVLDTSVLINFLCVDRAQLLHRLPDHTFLITDHVEDEVSLDYEEHRRRLKKAQTKRWISSTSLREGPEITLFADAEGARLGPGECAAISVAVTRGLHLGIDDRRASNYALSIEPQLRLFSTADIVKEAIFAQLLSIEMADKMKAAWADYHSFRLPFESFAEFISE